MNTFIPFPFPEPKLLSVVPWEWSQAEATERTRRPNVPPSLGSGLEALGLFKTATAAPRHSDNMESKSHQVQVPVQDAAHHSEQELVGVPAFTWGN